MSKYKALLFDMDGTIANTDKLVINSYLLLYEKIEPKERKTPEQLLYYSGPPSEVSLKKEYPDGNLEEISKFYREIEGKLYDTDVVNYPDCIETLKKLKSLGYKLACVTNKPRMMSYRTFNVLGMNDIFDVLVCAGDDDIKECKPARDMVDVALNKLGVSNRNEAIYIGDNNIDFETAENAGVDCMLVTWGPRVIEKNPKIKYFVSSFKEMFEVFENGK